jgi:DNA-binding LytR/AlgR family response regulator
VNNFVRVHRSYIVALAQVETISRNEITIGNTTLPIGHAYRPMLDEMIGKNG